MPAYTVCTRVCACVLITRLSFFPECSYCRVPWDHYKLCCTPQCRQLVPDLPCLPERGFTACCATCQDKGNRQAASPARAALKRNASVQPDGHVYRGSSHSGGLSQQEPLLSSLGPRLDVDRRPLCVPQAFTQLGLGRHVLENIRAALTKTQGPSELPEPPWSASHHVIAPALHKRGKRDLGADLLPETFWLRRC